jgi:hypothetical protein
MQTMLNGSDAPSEGHKRNCILIACYLGLSQHTIENIPFGSSSSARSRPCHTCGRRITLGNFAKHLATHDPNKKYKCEHCGYKDNRLDNFFKHEKTCRRRRMPHDLSDGLDNCERPPCLAEELPPHANSVFSDTRQSAAFDQTDFGKELATPLHQSRGAPKQLNFNCDLWPSSMSIAFSTTAATQIPDASQFAPSSWHSHRGADVFNQTPNASFDYGPAPEARFSFPPDQPSSAQPPVSDDFDLWSSNQLNANLEALSTATLFGLENGIIGTMTPQATANTNTMMDNPCFNMQSSLGFGQPLDASFSWPDASLDLWSGSQDHITQNPIPQDPLAQNPFVHGNLAYTGAESAPSFPNIGQQLYAQSIQSSLSGSTKRKYPSYPGDGGSDRATRIRRGDGGQRMW